MSNTPEVHPSASDPERRRFLCVLAETLDKLYRVDRLLSRQRTFLGTVSAEDSVSGVDALADFLDRHREELVAGSDAIVRFLRGKTSTEAERVGRVDALVDFLDKHREGFLAGSDAIVRFLQSRASNEAEGVSGVDALVDFLDKHREEFLASSDAIVRFLQGKTSNKEERDGIFATLHVLVARVLQVHELLLLIPREAALPQASFVLRDCFAATYPGASIVLTNFYSAYEYRFEDILKKINIEQEERGRLKQLKQGGDVLCQAFADRDNALAWAVLAHEYGHTLDEGARISERIVFGDERPKLSADHKSDWLVSVVAETVADFIAARVLGPASLMPILFLEMMQPQLKPPDKSSAGHPPTPLRVQLVREYLRDFGVVTADFEKDFQAYEYDYKWKVARMKKEEQETLNQLASSAGQVLVKNAPEIAAKVNGLRLRGFDKQNATNAREEAKVLHKTAKWGQPISSRRVRSDKKIFKALRSLKSGVTKRERAYEVIAAFDEMPVPSSEILTAGWLYKFSSFEAELMKTFPGAGRKADLEVYSEYVERTDRRLLKSLELAAVHAELRNRTD